MTAPLVHLIVELDLDVLEHLGLDDAYENKTILKHFCPDKPDNICVYLFQNVDLPEWAIGLIILSASLITLCVCLVGMVKVLSAIFKGSIAKLLQKVVNADLPGPFKYLTGYIAILIGCAFTILVQSSSVFISSLNPLVGMGLVSIERIFPLTLGSNIGTTVTGLLAAFATGATASPEKFQLSLRIALCHTLFNVTGILIWYPIPFFRKLPIFLAKQLGNISAEYRWFAIVYLLGVFLIIPLAIFGLSVAGIIAFWCVLGPIIFIIAFVVIINVFQKKATFLLPKFLRTWNFLPLALRSLKPYDRALRKTICRCKRFDKIEAMENESKLPDIITEKHYETTRI